MPFFRTILILLLIFFLWRFIKIIFRMLKGKDTYTTGSPYMKDQLKDIEEAEFEDITPEKKEDGSDKTDLPKN